MTDFVLSFDDIRPYYDYEVQEVFQRLIEKPSFFIMMGVLFPELTKSQIIEDLKNITRVEQFQAGYIHETLLRILAMSSKGFEVQGIENLKPDQAYLFISNHRDIILDSAFFNVALHDAGLNTTRIAIGDNLMVSNLITDLMKINKAFIVHRSVPRNQLMAYSERLSRYMRHSIINENSSIWIAQRSGRTKDGKDQTHPAVLKMLQISGTEDKVASFKELNIVPLAISYEFEPCDALKAEETHHKAHKLPYTKDDKRAMLSGIRSSKGRIKISIGRPLDDKLDSLPSLDNKNDWIKELAKLIDQEIHQLYTLWPSNYIAYDLLHQKDIFASKYTEEEKQSFIELMKKRLSKVNGDPSDLKKRFLGIYAGMVEVKEFENPE
ncbi:MAG: 1-acyl-sn-glycerol-3-phosphate acyltransferase [Bacteroidia bacterium]|nr:1-acyl-sn-glycerol-3-phosphate acyltransferase [Bacteroidia bacterium]